MARRPIVFTIVVVAAVLAALAYLRDPPWLLSTTSGMRGWETDSSGTRLRWMGGHASFFVPANARSIEMPLRTIFARGDDWPVVVTVTIDDRPAERLVLRDGRWQRIVVSMPAAGSRRVRRIDLRMDRTRDDNRSAAIGEVVVR